MMARIFITATTHLGALAARQPRIAVGTVGLVGVLLFELLALLLGSYPVL